MGFLSSIYERKITTAGQLYTLDSMREGETMILKQGDCLNLMKDIPDESIDLILCDPPYGMMKSIVDDNGNRNRHDWDNQVPIEKMFAEYSRILRKNGKVILFSLEPLTSKIRLISNSNIKFKSQLVWVKNTFGNPLIAKQAPVHLFEDLSVFQKQRFIKVPPDDRPKLREYARKLKKYIGKTQAQINHDMGDHSYQQFASPDIICFALPSKRSYERATELYNLKNMPGYLDYSTLKEYNKDISYCPNVFNLNGKKSFPNVLKFNSVNSINGDKPVHPTQKPVSLLKCLIKTYSNEGDTVLDNTMGSGSTGVACVDTQRDFIGYELDEHYFSVATKRIKETQQQLV